MLALLPFAQRGALDELHRDVHGARVLPDVVDRRIETGQVFWPYEAFAVYSSNALIPMTKNASCHLRFGSTGRASLPSRVLYEAT